MLDGTRVVVLYTTQHSTLLRSSRTSHWQQHTLY